MVDRAGPQQARGRVRGVERTLDDDPAARLEQPVDGAAQLTGGMPRMDPKETSDRGRAIGQEALDIVGERPPATIDRTTRRSPSFPEAGPAGRR